MGYVLQFGEIGKLVLYVQFGQTAHKEHTTVINIILQQKLIRR